MSDGSLNPYSPPPEMSGSSKDEASLESLLKPGPIAFHGNANTSDLNAYLRAHDHIGCGSMLITGLGLSMIILVFAVAIQGPIALVLVGILGFILLASVASMLPYRRSVFVSANPKWQETLSGEIHSDGVVVRNDDGEAFFGWDWFGNAIGNSQVVAFLPALHSHQPILITTSMLAGLDDWDRLTGVAKAIFRSSDDSNSFESRRYENRRRMRSANRARRLKIPIGAIAFEGAVKTRDLKDLPVGIARRNRPIRAYLLMIGLIGFLGLVLAGLFRLGGTDSFLGTIVFALVVIGLVLLFVTRRIRLLRTSNDTVYYLTAFADEEGLTSDFGVTSTKVFWEKIQPTRMRDESVLLARADVRQFIIARRDMFDSEADWQTFRGLLERKIG